MPVSFECPVCCLDFESEEVEDKTYALGCDHRFCKGCWTEYLERKILNEQESGRVQCMEDGCGRIVGEKTVFTLVNDKARDR
jgi:ariadne-1